MPLSFQDNAGATQVWSWDGAGGLAGLRAELGVGWAEFSRGCWMNHCPPVVKSWQYLYGKKFQKSARMISTFGISDIFLRPWGRLLIPQGTNPQLVDITCNHHRRIRTIITSTFFTCNLHSIRSFNGHCLRHSPIGAMLDEGARWRQVLPKDLRGLRSMSLRTSAEGQWWTRVSCEGSTLDLKDETEDTGAWW